MVVFDMHTLDGVEQPVQLDASMMDGLDLRGLQSPLPLPVDSRLIVSIQEKEILCIPLLRMTKVNTWHREEFQLYTIPHEHFAPNGLPGGHVYTIELRSRSLPPPTKLHYTSQYRLQAERVAEHRVLHYRPVHNTQKVELLASGRIQGLYILDYIREDLKISMVLNNMKTLEWDFARMLMYGKRLGGLMLLEIPDVSVKNLTSALLEISHPLSFYILYNEKVD